MISDLSSKKKSANIKTFCYFTVYSLFLIIGAMVFTSTNENLNLLIKRFGMVAFFSSPFILLFSVLMAMKNNVSKLMLFFCAFILPSLYFLAIELISTLWGLMPNWE